jgi:hydroxymethylglutaryl-CoA lyase
MQPSTPIQFVECPRDAMQGWPHFISTDNKVRYLNTLLEVGFHTLDFGSFVSPKAIPQMADTASVLRQLNPVSNGTRLLAIVANLRGAEDALQFPAIDFLGFPFSISETFQQRNSNASIADSFTLLKSIQERCVKHNKQMVVYLSMGFGNPYGDPYSEEIVYSWASKIAAEGISILSIADTVGLATPEQIERVTSYVVKALPQNEIGVHLHSAPGDWQQKTDAALRAGCSRFDGALMGIGGCPMAGNDLVGNMNSEKMLAYFEQLGRLPALNKTALNQALSIATELFV